MVADLDPMTRGLKAHEERRERTGQQLQTLTR